MVKNPIKLSIITVTYNNASGIERFIDTLLKNLPAGCEIIVYDNASEDNTSEVVSKFKKLTLIKGSQNLGFAKGCNRAVSRARGEYLLFLNPDVKVDNNISRMVSFLEDSPRVGLLVPKLLDTNGMPQTSVIKIPGLLGAIKEYFFGIKNAYSEYSPGISQPIEIEAAYGAAFLAKRSLFEKLGGFDERYFLYYEDIDLCRRIKRLGLKVVYYPMAVFTHHKGQSTKTISVKGHDKLSGVLSWFFPIKSSGSRYFLVQSSNIYHGVIKSLLIHLVIFLGLKLRL